MSPEVRVFDGPEQLAAAVADDFLDLVAGPPPAPQRGDVALHEIALTGGSIADRIHRAVAASKATADVDWSRVRFWWGDERFVAPDSPDRNAGQARRALLDRLPDALVEEIPSTADTADAAEAAAAYAARIRSAGTGGWSLVMLGIGPDGHVASLFPGHATLRITDEIAVAEVDSPKPPPQRVSLTFEALERTDRVWFVASGEEKAGAVARALATGGSVEETPARGVRCEDTVWYLDRAAASHL